MPISLQNICIDCADPIALGRWWSEFLGWRIADESDHEVELEPPDGGPPDGACPNILFLKVPETKTAKNRLHLDLRPADQAAEVARAEAMGATRVDIGQGAQTWVVMADPAGNEFCILRARVEAERA